MRREARPRATRGAAPRGAADPAARWRDLAEEGDGRSASTQRERGAGAAAQSGATASAVPPRGRNGAPPSGPMRLARPRPDWKGKEMK